MVDFSRIPARVKLLIFGNFKLTPMHSRGIFEDSFKMSQFMKFCSFCIYEAKAQTSLHKHTVSPEPSLL